MGKESKIKSGERNKIKKTYRGRHCYEETHDVFVTRHKLSENKEYCKECGETQKKVYIKFVATILNISN